LIYTSYIINNQMFILTSVFRDALKNQVEHHKIVSFKDEYIALLKENGIEFDEKYLF